MIPGIGAVVAAADASPLEVTIVSVSKLGSPWDNNGELEQNFSCNLHFSRPWPGGQVTIIWVHSDNSQTATSITPPAGSTDYSNFTYFISAESYTIKFQLFASSQPGISQYIVNPGPYNL